jgi:hypothetical protein
MSTFFIVLNGKNRKFYIPTSAVKTVKIKSVLFALGGVQAYTLPNTASNLLRKDLVFDLKE